MLQSHEAALLIRNVSIRACSHQASPTFFGTTKVAPLTTSRSSSTTIASPTGSWELYDDSLPTLSSRRPEVERASIFLAAPPGKTTTSAEEEKRRVRRYAEKIKTNKKRRENRKQCW